MEVAPSVAFHDRAPDLMTEEDLQHNHLEAEESANRLTGSIWQPPRDMQEGFPAEKADRADLSFDLPSAKKRKAEVPVACSAERADRGETSYGFAETQGKLTCSGCCSMMSLFTLQYVFASHSA